ncbi:hypothetical protein FRB94_007949 [Tulasnella sp. JGI-2019a]|nr:hypothetical protein FRB93_005028 [Tulasnella sp. JGI-2019a]KAG8996961.1 hypothetical protein FRB94_007949 [Tulasnella sp. JGI-2019a]KAG9029090.1 hypothetical protein FRB95_005739 [Tulasnella sp. JGI-2019a]
MPKATSSKGSRAPAAHSIISVKDICSSFILPGPSGDSNVTVESSPLTDVDDQLYTRSTTLWSSTLTKVNKLNEDYFDCGVLNYQEHLSRQPHENQIPIQLEPVPGVLQDLRPVLHLVQPLIGAAYHMEAPRNQGVYVLYPKVVAPINHRKLCAKLPTVPVPTPVPADGAAIFVVGPSLMTDQHWEEFLSKRNVYRSKPQKNSIIAVPKSPWTFVDSLWALILNRCNQSLGTRWWILTTYERWIFGVISPDKTNVIVTALKRFDAHNPTLVQALVYWHISSLENRGLPPAYLPPFDSPRPRPQSENPAPDNHMNYEVPPPLAITRLLNGDAPIPIDDKDRGIKSSAATSPYGTRAKTFLRGAFVERDLMTGEANVVKLSEDRLAQLRYKSVWLVQGNNIPGLVGSGRRRTDDDNPVESSKSPRKGKSKASKPLSSRSRGTHGRGSMRKRSEMDIDEDDEDNNHAMDEDDLDRTPTRLSFDSTPNLPSAVSDSRLPSFMKFDHAPGIVNKMRKSLQDGANNLAAPSGGTRGMEDLTYKGELKDPSHPWSIEYFMKEKTSRLENFTAWARYHGWTGQTIQVRQVEEEKEMNE